MSTQKLPEVFGDWIRVWGKGRIVASRCEVFCRKDAIILAADIDGAYIGYDGHTMEITDEVYESLVRLLSRDSMAYDPQARDPQPYNGKGLVPTGFPPRGTDKAFDEFIEAWGTGTVAEPPPEVTKAFARANGEG